MAETTQKIVRHDIFCKGGELDGKKFAPCEYMYVSETDDPCNECLSKAVNDNSRKPVNYIAKEKK